MRYATKFLPESFANATELATCSPFIAITCPRCMHARYPGVAAYTSAVTPFVFMKEKLTQSYMLHINLDRNGLSKRVKDLSRSCAVFMLQLGAILQPLVFGRSLQKIGNMA